MWAVVVLHGLLLAVTSLVQPTYRAADEAAHVDMVLAVLEADGYPGVGEREIAPEVVASVDVAGGQQPGPLHARAAPPRRARPAFDALGGMPGTGVPQQMAAHPPLYYVTAAGALATVTTLVPVDWSFDQVVGLLRLVSAALVLPLPLLAFRTAERLRASPPVAVAAAIVPLAVPGLTQVGAGVTNDGLLVLLAALLTLLAVRVAGGDLRSRTALAAGGVAGLALLTKGFALFAPVLLAVAYGVGAARTGPRRAVKSGVLALAIAAAAGGWWWARNLLVHGTLQPAGLPSPAPPPGFVPDAGAWAARFLGGMARSFWLGETLGAAVPALVGVLATGALTVLVVAALVAAWTGRPATPRSAAPTGARSRAAGPDRLVLAVPPAVLGAIVTFGAWRVYARSGQPLAIHGRYLYAALPALAVLAVLGAGALLRRRARWLPLAALGAAAAAQAGALALALATFWAPPRVAAVLAWSPWPAWLVGLALGGGTALVVWIGGVRPARFRGQEAPPAGRYAP